MGGMLVQLVEAARGMTEVEAYRFLTTGELPEDPTTPTAEASTEPADDQQVMNLDQATAVLAGWTSVDAVVAGGFLDLMGSPSKSPPSEVAFKFDPKQLRDPNTGEWIDNPVGKVAKKALKTTVAIFNKNIKDGDVISHSDDDTQRVRWDASRKKFAIEEKKDDDWVEVEALGKSALYKKMQQESDQWFEPTPESEKIQPAPTPVSAPEKVVPTLVTPTPPESVSPPEVKTSEHVTVSPSVNKPVDITPLVDVIESHSGYTFADTKIQVSTPGEVQSAMAGLDVPEGNINGVTRHGKVYVSEKLFDADGTPKSPKKGSWFSRTDAATAVEQTATHELGHVAYDKLTSAQRRAVLTAAAQTWGGTASEGKGLDPWLAENKAKIKQHVSGYAASHYQEVIPELWVEYKTSKKPRPAAIAAGKLIEQYLNDPNAKKVQTSTNTDLPEHTESTPELESVAEPTVKTKLSIAPMDPKNRDTILAEIEGDGERESFIRAAINEAFGKKSTTYLARDTDGKLVGAINVKDWSGAESEEMLGDRIPTSYVEYVGALEGTGAGTQLLRQAIEHTLASKSKALHLQGTDTSIGYWEKQGLIDDPLNLGVELPGLDRAGMKKWLDDHPSSVFVAKPTAEIDSDDEKNIDAEIADISARLNGVFEQNQVYGDWFKELFEKKFQKASGVLNKADQHLLNTANKKLEEAWKNAQPDVNKLIELLAQKAKANQTPSIDDDYWSARPEGKVQLRHKTNKDAMDKIAERYVGKDLITITHHASLRSDDPDEKALAWAKSISRMVNSGEITEDTRVYRGAAFSPEFVASLTPGTVLHDKAFMSAGFDDSTARHYAGARQRTRPGYIPTIFEIRVRSGTPAYEVENDELVFDRNTTLRIQEVREDNGYLRIIASMD